MLQRARLGELDDQELAELMDRLEAAGELERLDEAIRADQDFLEKYPAQHMAPLIRNRMERQMRERERATPSRKGDKMLSQRSVFAHPITAAVVAAVVAALVVLVMQQTADEPEAIADNDDTVEELQPAAPAPAEPAGPFPTFAERIDRRLSPIGELVLTPGEQLTVSTEGVSKVQIDQTRIVPPPRLVDNDSKFIFEPKSVGLTGMRMHYKSDQVADQLYVRVLPWHQGEFSDGVKARSPNSRLEECDEMASAQGLEGTIAVRLIVTPAGGVASGWIESSEIADPALEACVEKAAQKVEHPPSEGSSTALMRYTFPIDVPDD